MEKTIYDLTSEDFIKKSRIPVRVLKDEQTMYEEIADIMVRTILENRNKRTVFICPVGPVAQYPIFADKVNKQKINLKNVWIINMDEYLDNDDQWIPSQNILSFHGIMEKLLYSKINPALIMPKEQRLFPVPGREAEIDELIEKLGNADCCLTGVGINGHIAFNEPPEKSENITDKEFAGIGTRCLNLSMATKVNNGANKLFGALELMPSRCISLGMEQLLNSKMIKIYLYCSWQWGVMRKIALELPSRFTPASFLQSHPNSEMVITRSLYEKSLL